MRMMFLVIALFVWNCGSRLSAQTQPTYDIGKYFICQNNYWRIDVEREAGSTLVKAKRGKLVQSQGENIYVMDFDRLGTLKWALRSISYYKLTSLNLEYYGQYDPGSGGYSYFKEPLRVPRLMELDKMYSTKSYVTDHNNITRAVWHTFVLTGEKLTKTTNAGTFTNCVRLKSTQTTKDDVVYESEVLAPVWGTVSLIEVQVDETKPEKNVLDVAFLECEQKGVYPTNEPDLK